jgi:hypothetical protein
LAPFYILGVVWLATAGINLGTGRAMRFELSLFLWIFTNLLLISTGKGMYEVFLFFLLPAVLTGVTDYFGVGGITVENAFFFPALNLIPYCLFGALRRYYPERNALARRNRIGPYLTLFVFAAILSALFGHGVKYPTQAFRAIGVIFIIPFFYYLYASHAIRRLANIRQIAVVMVCLTAFYSVPLGIIQIYNRSHCARILRNLVYFPEDKIEKMWKVTFGEGKTISIWPDAASFGHVLCFTLPLAFGLVLTARNSRQRLFFLGNLVLLFVGIMITGNRTDILGAMATMGLIVLAFWRNSPTLRGLIFKFALIAVLAGAVVVSSRSSNGLTRLFMPQDWDKKTASSRTILIQEGVRMFQSSPVFGVGLDNFRFNQDYRMDGMYIVGNYAHNLFVQILAETGVVGFMAFLLLMGTTFSLAHITWKHRMETELDFFCFLFFTGCVVLTLQGLIENSLFYVQTACLFWTGVGIWRGRAMELATAR